MCWKVTAVGFLYLVVRPGNPETTNNPPRPMNGNLGRPRNPETSRNETVKLACASELGAGVNKPKVDDVFVNPRTTCNNSAGWTIEGSRTSKHTFPN